MPAPEQRARRNIDKLLQQCSWIVQDRAEINLGAARCDAGAVADNVNADNLMYRIRTQISEQGSTVEAGY